MQIRRWFIGLTAALLVSVGCQRQHKPSSAGDTGGQDAAVEDIFAQQRKVEEAEKEVIAFVKSDTNRWVQHEFGWWYRYEHKGDGHMERKSFALPIDTCCLICERVYAMSGVLLVDAVREFCTAKTAADEGHEPIAYRYMVSELVPEDTVSLIIPWPMGYGSHGYGFIPPYTSIRVQLSLHTTPYTDVNLEDTEETNIL